MMVSKEKLIPKIIFMVFYFKFKLRFLDSDKFKKKYKRCEFGWHDEPLFTLHFLWPKM